MPPQGLSGKTGFQNQRRVSRDPVSKWGGQPVLVGQATDGRALSRERERCRGRPHREASACLKSPSGIWIAGAPSGRQLREASRPKQATVALSPFLLPWSKGLFPLHKAVGVDGMCLLETHM